MKTEDIDKLIAKFYEGETDVKEEKLLMQYLREEDCNNIHETDKKVLFSLTGPESEISSDLGIRISSLIDSWEEDEKKVSKNYKKLELKKKILSIAATLLLVISIGLWHQHQSQSTDNLTTKELVDSQESYEIVVEALNLFSDNFSIGAETIEKAENQIDNTLKILNNVLNQETK